VFNISLMSLDGPNRCRSAMLRVNGVCWEHHNISFDIHVVYVPPDLLPPESLAQIYYILHRSQVIRMPKIQIESRLR
jgi:hypothetical protein